MSGSTGAQGSCSKSKRLPAYEESLEESERIETLQGSQSRGFDERGWA